MRTQKKMQQKRQMMQRPPQSFGCGCVHRRQLHLTVLALLMTSRWLRRQPIGMAVGYEVATSIAATTLTTLLLHRRSQR